MCFRASSGASDSVQLKICLLTCLDGSAKTGIGNRALKPTLGVIDPINMETMPRQVAIASGFDVLCHSLESYTAIPYNQRSPRPLNPNLRPAYQGSNPISDVWCQQSLKVCAVSLCVHSRTERVKLAIDTTPFPTFCCVLIHELSSL